MVHIDVCLSGLVEGFQLTHAAGLAALVHLAATYGCYLAAAEDAVAHRAAVHGDVGYIDIAAFLVSAAEDVAALVQQFVAGRILIDVLHPRGAVVLVAYVAVVHGNVGGAIDGSTLTTAIDASLNGWYAVSKCRAAEVAYGDVRLA